jgi:hypothetical protein
MVLLVRRGLIASIGAALVALIFGPWVLYAVALSNVTSRPALPTNGPVAASDAEAVWRKLRERGPIVVEPLSPHRYLLVLLTNDTLPPGAHVAWSVARNHNQERLADQRVIWWNLSGAALTIWLTRNWTTDQLVAKAHEIIRSSQPASSQRFEPTGATVSLARSSLLRSSARGSSEARGRACGGGASVTFPTAVACSDFIQRGPLCPLPLKILLAKR